MSQVDRCADCPTSTVTEGYPFSPWYLGKRKRQKTIDSAPPVNPGGSYGDYNLHRLLVDVSVEQQGNLLFKTIMHRPAIGFNNNPAIQYTHPPHTYSPLTELVLVDDVSQMEIYAHARPIPDIPASIFNNMLIEIVAQSSYPGPDKTYQDLEVFDPNKVVFTSLVEGSFVGPLVRIFGLDMADVEAKYVSVNGLTLEANGFTALIWTYVDGTNEKFLLGSVAIAAIPPLSGLINDSPLWNYTASWIRTGNTLIDGGDVDVFAYAGLVGTDDWNFSGIDRQDWSCRWLLAPPPTNGNETFFSASQVAAGRLVFKFNKSYRIDRLELDPRSGVSGSLPDDFDVYTDEALNNSVGPLSYVKQNGTSTASWLNSIFTDTLVMVFSTTTIIGRIRFYAN